MPNQCSVKNNVFSCSCNTQFCSSDHNYLMKLWKKSPNYSKNNKYTVCLQQIIRKDWRYGDSQVDMGQEDEAFEENQQIHGEMSDAEEDDREDIEAMDALYRRRKLSSSYISAVNLAIALVVIAF